MPSLLMALKGLFAKVPLRSIRSNIEGLLACYDAKNGYFASRVYAH